MVRFLSEAWLDEMEAAAGRVRGPVPEGGATDPLTLRQVVTGGPDGDVVYDLRLDGRGVAVRRPGTDEPDVSFEQDHDTARRLARGETHPQIELTSGRLRVAGAANRLVAWKPLLDALDDELAALRSVTTW
jgi:hypothetical protein